MQAPLRRILLKKGKHQRLYSRGCSHSADLEFRVDTFFWHLELAALSDLDGLGWLVAGALRRILDFLDNLVALEDLAEDDVAAIEPASDDGRDEELGSVGVLLRLVDGL